MCLPALPPAAAREDLKDLPDVFTPFKQKVGPGPKPTPGGTRQLPALPGLCLAAPGRVRFIGWPAVPARPWLRPRAVRGPLLSAQVLPGAPPRRAAAAVGAGCGAPRLPAPAGGGPERCGAQGAPPAGNTAARRAGGQGVAATGLLHDGSPMVHSASLSHWLEDSISSRSANAPICCGLVSRLHVSSLAAESSCDACYVC